MGSGDYKQKSIGNPCFRGPAGCSAHHDDTSASENVYIHTRVVQQQQVERLDNAMLRRIQAGLRQPDNGEKIMEQEIAVFS